MALISEDPEIQRFLTGKSQHTIDLYTHFIEEFAVLGDIRITAAKTMVGISNDKKRIAWITQFGRNFLHVYIPFKQAYEDNLCFQKIATFTGSKEFNHHLRIFYKEDINDEVKRFLKLALREG